MSLISYQFFLLILPLTLLLYWKIARTNRQKQWVLCLISIGFYALISPQFLPLMIGLSVLTFWLAQRRQFWLAIGLNLIPLMLLKYVFNLTETIGGSSGESISQLIYGIRFAFLPLGISYYVFKHIGYLLDVRSGRYPAETDLVVFAAYSSFFPQITTGPISAYDDTGFQLRSLPDRLTDEQRTSGLIHLSMGLAKKMLIAETLIHSMKYFLPAEIGYRPELGFLGTWAYLTLVALNLYFDFSGYTDIVLGVGLLFGITQPPNFDNPFLAKNPSDFWQRWHISLSLWFRVYVFSPLSRVLLKRLGTQRRELAQYLATLITMMLVGIWHGPTVIGWGLYQGALMVIVAAAVKRGLRIKTPIVPALLNFIAFVFGLALIPRLEFSPMNTTLLNMLGMNGLGRLPYMDSTLGTLIPALVVMLVMITTGCVEARNLPTGSWSARVAHASMFGLGILAILSLLQLGEVRNFAYVAF